MYKSIFAALLLVSACHRDREASGPFEKAGQGLDTATDKTGTALKGAAVKTGGALDSAGRATGRAFKKVGSDLGVRGTDSAPGAQKPEPAAPAGGGGKSAADE